MLSMWQDHMSEGPQVLNYYLWLNLSNLKRKTLKNSLTDFTFLLTDLSYKIFPLCMLLPQNHLSLIIFTFNFA